MYIDDKAISLSAHEGTCVSITGTLQNSYYLKLAFLKLSFESSLKSPF